MSEQVAVAALECGAIDFAQSVVREVARKFPQSSRTKRLQGKRRGAADGGGHDLAIASNSKGGRGGIMSVVVASLVCSLSLPRVR